MIGSTGWTILITKLYNSDFIFSYGSIKFRVLQVVSEVILQTYMCKYTKPIVLIKKGWQIGLSFRINF